MSLVEEYASGVLDAPAGRLRSNTLAAGLRAREIVGLTDIWAVLVVLWVFKIGAHLDVVTALFGTLGISLLYPTWRRAERLTLGALDDLSVVAGRISIAFLFASGAGLILGAGNPSALFFVAAGSFAAVLVGRTLSYKVVRARRARMPLRTLVVGGGEVAKRLIEGLSRRADHGLDVVGIIDDAPLLEADLLGAPVLGRLDRMPHLLETLEIDAVVVAFSSSDNDSLSIIRAALEGGKKVWAVPRLFEFGGTAPASDHVWGLPMVRLSEPASTRSHWMFKRAVDVIISGLSLIFAAPLMAAIALMIARDSSGPILLRQERVGRHGRPFKCLKFRSMRPVDPGVEATDWAPDDARITKVGRWLRDTSMDELPQLINVLRGDMSLVGPRPERPYFVHMFGQLYPRYDQRHRVPAGVTGLAQINGLRGDTSIEERVAFDNYYIENWSLMEDLKILMRTVRSLKG